MVVDDDSTVRDVTAWILEDDLGYAVVRAGSGGAALVSSIATPMSISFCSMLPCPA